jgi:chromosomal replication initiation ATPase DnaA
MLLGGVTAFSPPVTRRTARRLVDRLVTSVCEYYGLGDEAILSSNRRRGEISLARWALARVLMDDMGWSSLRVAKLFNADHKGILYGRKKSDELLRTDPLFFEAVSRLREEIVPQ